MNRLCPSAIVLAASLLAGCAGPPPGPAAPAPAPTAAAPVPAPAPEPQCNAAGAQFAVGQTSTPQLEAAAAYRAGAVVARSLRRGQPATTEVDPGRLTLEVNAQGKVGAVRCG
ncbi:MAG: peptidase inhibitor I78 [Comamonadaceae bacterium]|nr:MAG: peptidase inhibitor I78 [Comamonadaceae bacterium]